MLKKRYTRWCYGWLFGFIIPVIWLQTAHASTILEKGFDEMVAGAEFVFEGEVIDIRAERSLNCPAIHTFVTFRILETLKGSYPQNKIRLRFLGGQVGELKQTVGNMKIPALHEKGIYFVESLKRHQVNPLYGWSQGHLLIQADKDGQGRVFANDHRPVLAIEPDGPPKKGASQQRAFSRGIARGLVVGSSRDASNALSSRQFKDALRKQVEDLK